MIRTYARRLLSPFVGLVQVAETARARALSLDGSNWAIQYSLAGDVRSRRSAAATEPGSQVTLVATIEDGRLRPRAVHPFLDPTVVRSTVGRLFEAVKAAPLPFAAADRYEYWLLDGREGRPLALLHACIDEDEMSLTPPRPAWIAMPAAQLDVPSPPSGRDDYVPPVNYRLQRLVEERAGVKPRAAWFERRDMTSEDFPPCLLSEDWEDEERQRLCDLYVRRLAPRLLMLQGLSRSVRQRLERAARAHVFDVARFYPLYPEVIDRELLTAARVEARLRSTADGWSG
jgi:hypothetical protein